jgi:glycolate oxidase iron-sulfur subunit
MLSFKTAKILQQVGVAPQKVLEVLSAPYRWSLGEKSASPECRRVLPLQIALPHRPLKDDQQVYKPEKKIGRVALFTGCSINFLFPSLGISLINVLLRLGYEVVLPKGEVCCGAPFRSLGLEDDAVELATKNHEIFSKLNAEAILSLCPTCVLSIKTHYPKLLGHGLGNVMDVSNFLLKKLGSRQLFPVGGFRTVTYHDPCHLNYSLGIKSEPRELIRLAGIELLDAGGDGCCGFGGLFSLHHRELSRSLLEKRVDAYSKTGAEAVVTACPGCILQLSSRIKDRPIFHIVELVEEAMCGSRETANR